MSTRILFANAVSVPSTSNDLTPEPVHPLVNWLSKLWLWPRQILLRRKVRDLIVERVAGHSFVVLPDVFNPGIFRTGRFLADYIQKVAIPNADGISERPSALDVGTGCGVHAILAAAEGFEVEVLKKDRLSWELLQKVLLQLYFLP